MGGCWLVGRLVARKKIGGGDALLDGNMFFLKIQVCWKAVKMGKKNQTLFVNWKRKGVVGVVDFGKVCVFIYVYVSMCVGNFFVALKLNYAQI